MREWISCWQRMFWTVTGSGTGTGTAICPESQYRRPVLRLSPLLYKETHRKMIPQEEGPCGARGCLLEPNRHFRFNWPNPLPFRPPSSPAGWSVSFSLLPCLPLLLCPFSFSLHHRLGIHRCFLRVASLPVLTCLHFFSVSCFVFCVLSIRLCFHCENGILMENGTSIGFRYVGRERGTQ